MTFMELVKALRYGDLSAHGIFIEDSVSDINMEKLLYHTNQALIDIYTKYPLLQKELVIIQKSWMSQYVVDKKYAYSAEPQDSNWYIRDSKYDPYLGDLLKIVQVTSEEGENYVLNGTDICGVINTPAPNVIEIPSNTDTNALFVTYRAAHPEVTKEGNLIIPANWYPALYALIAHKVYAGGTAPEHIAKSQEFLQKFELFCSQQRDYGMANEDIYMSLQSKFLKEGWY